MRLQLPTLNIGNGFGEQEHDGEPRLSNEEEDALVRVSTCGFANFVTSLFHRVITLMENLPEEGQAGTRAGGADEGESFSPHLEELKFTHGYSNRHRQHWKRVLADLRSLVRTPV